MATKIEPSDQVLDEILKIRKINNPEVFGKEEYSIIWRICNAFKGFGNLVSFQIDHEFETDSDVCFSSFKCFLVYDNSERVQDGHSFVLQLNSQNLSNYPFDLDENMYISLSLIDKNKRIRNIHTKLIKTIDNNISTIIFEKFINEDNFYDENYVLFDENNDEFRIHCKIYFGEERNITEEIFLNDDVSTLKIFDDSEELFQNGSDIKFIIGDRGIKAHKHILSVQSPVLKTIIENYTPEETDITIEINDVSYETMKEVLRFIYTGKVNDIKNIAKDIFLPAEKYEINALKILCEVELIESLSVENISDMLKLVDQYDSENLKQSVLNFLCNNRKEINDTTKFHETLNTLSFYLLTFRGPENHYSGVTPDRPLPQSQLVISDTFLDHFLRAITNLKYRSSKG